MSDSQPGDFVCAALPSVWTHVKNVLQDHPDYMSDESVNKFFNTNVNKFLTSIGVVIPKLPTDPKKREAVIKKGRMKPELIAKYVSFLEKFNQAKFLNGTERIIDSGAFSMQVGYFDRSEIPQFIDLYNNEFLKKQSHNYDYAFLFDVAPGAKECPFTSFEDMDALAEESYRVSYNLPESVRKKLIYVHHFRTPHINKTYKYLLPKYADGFENFATGGLVSFSRTGNAPAYIMYAIPLIHIIQHARMRGLKKFRFHVLGGSEWKEIIGHKFFERHIKEIFDIDVQITFDSSTLFKTLCLGRYTFQYDPIQKKISKLSLRSQIKDSYAGIPGSDRYNSKTNEEVFCDLVNEAVVPAGMKALDLTQIDLYNDLEVVEECDIFTNEHKKLKGNLSRLAYMYGMFQLLRLFKVAEGWCEDFVEENYPLYQDHSDFSLGKFSRKIDNFMIMLNGGETMSDALLKFRALSIQNSLDLLTQLRDDPETTLQKCDYLIDTFMCNDECEQLRSNLSKEDNSIFADLGF